MSQQPSESGDSDASSLPKPAPYPDGLAGLLAINSSLLFLFNQNQLLVEENRLLRAQAAIEESEREEAQAQNRLLKSLAGGVRQAPKRRYAKRRSWLQKKFKCEHSGCQCAYSSKIALNLHTRKRHSLLKIEA